jgi:hypothetical protein
MSAMSPEEILLKLLQQERSRMREKDYETAHLYVEHNECGLAYDLFVFLERSNGLILTEVGKQLLLAAANALQIRYPALSTD